MIELGTTAKDQITNFTGIVTGHARYITGCDQYLIVPTNPDKEPKWLDEQRLIVDETVPVVVIDNSNGNGADLPAPIK